MQDPVFTVSGRYGDVSLTVRADTFDDLTAQLTIGLGDTAATDVFVNELFTEAFLGSSEAARAARQVNRSVGVSAVSHSGPDVPQTTVPVPGPESHAQAQTSNPPGVTYPGDCQHGRRRYVDNTLPGQSRPWRRWECARPWSRQNAQTQCRAVSV